jgi:hypothetical protein
VLTIPRGRRAHLQVTVRALVAGAVLVAASGCGGHSSHAAAWTACPRPSSHADIRRFRVRGGETCAKAKRILDWVSFGHEGSCGRACRHLGYTCSQVPGGLKREPSGGSTYTYSDDTCVRGERRAAWRIVFH